MKHVIFLPAQDADKPQSEATPTHPVYFTQMSPFSFHIYSSKYSKPLTVIIIQGTPENSISLEL